MFTIDLRLFEPKYRQALLYAMIDGLVEGKSFSFTDDRSPLEIETELLAADLPEYHWQRRDTLGCVSYRIERRALPPGLQFTPTNPYLF